MEQVEKTYQAWFRIFKETVVPRLIPQPKWFNIEKDLKEKDLVYFQKKDSPLSSTWTVGQVDQIIASRDGFIRRAIIKYFNAGENHPQLTDRSVRKMIKLWSIDEACLSEDLVELQERLDKTSVVQETGTDAASAKVADCSYTTTAVVKDGIDILSSDQGFQCLETSASENRGVMAASSFSPILSSISGFYCGSEQPRYVAGPTYVTLDGTKFDLAAFSVSCDLTPLLVQHHQHVEEVDEDSDQEGQAANLDTLHRVMVSTGFCLD